MPGLPRVSVVIASFNHRPYIRQCLASVFDQDWQDFEILLTDDGSADGTADAAREHADPRLSVQAFERNHGACVALNHGLRRARGEFVAILNSDDWFLPGKLAKQVAYLDAHPDVGAVFGHPVLVDEQGAAFTDEAHKDFSAFRTENRGRHAWLRHFFDQGNCLCHPTVLIRRACYDRVGLYDSRLAQVPDLDMWMRLCRHFEIHVLPEPVLAFRIRDNQQNASAARPEVIIRDIWERRHILDNYLNLETGDLLRVFPEFAAAAAGDARRQCLAGLARHAIALGAPFHVGFGMDLWHGTLDKSGESLEYIDFIRTTGQHDLYQAMRCKKLEEEVIALRQKAVNL